MCDRDEPYKSDGQSESAVQRSEQKFRAIFEAVADAVIMIDEKGIVQSFNPGAEKTFGYRAEDVVGRNVEILMPEEFAQDHDVHVARYIKTDASSVIGARRNLLGLRKDGTTFPMDLTVTEASIAGQRMFTGIARDITDWKQIQTEIIEAKKQAEFANRAKSQFLANMSHELRTPLNAILGFSEIIHSQAFGPVVNPKYLEYAMFIHQSGKQLLALTNDILDLSKIEAGKAVLHEEVVNVAKAAGSCLLLVKGRAKDTGVNLKADIADSLPLLYADERKLKQILINLLSNAIKFTLPGGQVTIRARPHSDDGFVFQVSDTGIGIALEDIPKALAPFSQIDSMFSRKHNGTGLGLPLTKSLTELHGGSLDLQSEVGVGTTVTVRFPAARVFEVPPENRSGL